MPTPLITEYRILINKYLDGNISAEEVHVLERYYNLFLDEPDVTEQLDDATLDKIETRLSEGIANRIKQLEKPIVPLYYRAWFRIAAVGLIFLTIALILFKRSVTTPQYAVANRQKINQVTAIADRFIVLPDNSHIVLHKGGVINVSEQFGHGKTREVTLTGEAYFDIMHNSHQPFIIHAGGITVSVLGTAFNIQAYAGQNKVTVTVTRGKVKIERRKKLLGVLTANKQLAADINTEVNNNEIRQVVASQALLWTKADMSFDNMSFAQLAQRLAKRYDVQIGFKNAALSGCPITGRFKGTETLTEVLDILSQTRGTTYTIIGKSVVIDGKGCNE